MHPYIATELQHQQPRGRERRAIDTALLLQLRHLHPEVGEAELEAMLTDDLRRAYDDEVARRHGCG